MEYPEHEKFSHEGLTNALIYALETAIAGTDPKFWYTGVMSATETLHAEQASRIIAPGHTSIAAHLEHVRVSLNYVRRTLKGEAVEVDWPATWETPTLNAAQWHELRKGIKVEYEVTAKH